VHESEALVKQQSVGVVEQKNKAEVMKPDALQWRGMLHCSGRMYLASVRKAHGAHAEVKAVNMLTRQVLASQMPAAERLSARECEEVVRALVESELQRAATRIQSIHRGRAGRATMAAMAPEWRGTVRCYEQVYLATVRRLSAREIEVKAVNMMTTEVEVTRVPVTARSAHALQEVAQAYVEAISETPPGSSHVCPGGRIALSANRVARHVVKQVVKDALERARAIKSTAASLSANAVEQVIASASQQDRDIPAAQHSVSEMIDETISESLQKVQIAKASAKTTSANVVDDAIADAMQMVQNVNRISPQAVDEAIAGALKKLNAANASSQNLSVRLCFL